MRRKPEDDADDRPRRIVYSINKHPIRCKDCGADVPAGQARIWKARGQWQGAHKAKDACQSPAAAADQEAAFWGSAAPVQAPELAEEDVLGVFSGVL